MKTKTFLTAALLFTLLLTACAPQAAPTASEAPPVNEPTVTKAPAPTEEGYGYNYDAPQGATPTSESAAPTKPGSEATLKVSQKDGLGAYLVDSQGVTLYMSLADPPNTSTCSGNCANNWPALTVSGQPVPGEGVDASLLGTIQRADGTTQVTYNGHPLYRFIRDTNPGDANGQGAGGSWYVVSPSGEPIK